MLQNKHRILASMIAVLLLCCFGGIIVRLVDLQILQNDTLKEVSDKERAKIHILQGNRGRILDARGDTLAMSMPKKTVVADVRLLSSLDLPAQVAPVIVQKTAQILGLDERYVWNRLNRDSSYVVIAHKIKTEAFQQLTNAIFTADFGINPDKLTRRQRAKFAEARRSAIYAAPRDEYERVYPSGSLAAHILGYVDGEHRGLNGIEKQFESRLRAYDGIIETDKDALGRSIPLYERRRVLPHDGLDVQLTIDQYIQGVLEEELDKAMELRRPDSIIGIVIRPRTGEILAMSVRPGFDPNSPSKEFARYPSLSEAMSALRNRCVTDLAEPGSTFKIVAVAGALNEHVVSLSDPFDCASPFYFCGVPLHDSHHYGMLSVMQVITKSSNIGAGKIGIRLGDDRLYRYIRAFGFGQRTGVDLPAEASGIVHPPARWSKISIAHIPMGHEVAVTPLQMCMAMASLANNGRLMKPMLVSSVMSPDGKVFEKFSPSMVRQVVTPETADQMVEALQTVTEHGTGTKGAVPGYDVAGKTGTAQKIQDGHYVQKYFASFVGFFPAKHPELCIQISLDNPNDPHGKYYGGDVAAPVFRAVAERVAKYLHIRLDHPINEVAVGAAGSAAQVATNKTNATQKIN